MNVPKRNLILRIWQSFSEQWCDQWVTIIITLIITLLTFLIGVRLTLGELSQRNTPLFKYSYDQDTKSLSSDLGGDFAPVIVNWFIPGINSTSTSVIKNRLEIKDITKAILISNLRNGVNLNPFDINWSGYLKCLIFDQLGAESTSTLEGFPVGVEISYVLRGDTTLHKNYDLLLLREFDFEPIQVYTLPNVSRLFLMSYLLEKGNKRLEEVIQRNPYDINGQYLNDDGTCRQTSWQYSEILLK